jgi:hypothetical protein
MDRIARMVASLALVLMGSSASATEIFACRNIQTGLVRIVGAGQACLKSEVPVRWAATEVPICRGRPGGTCSNEAKACAFDRDCNGGTCAWTPGTCSVTTTRSCLSDAGCPTGERCSTPRFVDNKNGTVTDRRTCLTWEKKLGTYDTSALRDCQQVDCSSGLGWRDVNAFVMAPVASYLAQVQGLGDRYDWRIPVSPGVPGECAPPPDSTPCGNDMNDPELESIVLSPCPGGGAACVDAAFGATAPGPYWTASERYGSPKFWRVDFATGQVNYAPGAQGGFVRAVRGP